MRPNDTQLLTVQQVQQRLAVSRACVYALIQAGKLPCVRIGNGRGTIRVDASDLTAFIEHNKQSAGEPRSVKANRSMSGSSAFIHLDASRLREAWKGDE